MTTLITSSATATTVRIGRFRHCTLLPASLATAAGDAEPQVRHTVDRLTGVLPGVIAGLGLPPSAIICIRSLSVRLRVGAGDLADTGLLAQVWAEAIARGVETACAGGSSASDHEPGIGEVVVFRNPAAALADLVRRVSRGDRRRQWAWQQAGLCAPSDGDHPVALVIGACLRTPGSALPVLAWAAAQGLLGALALSWASWHALSRALVPRGLDSVEAIAAPAVAERRDATPGVLGAGRAALPSAVRAAAVSAPLAREIRTTAERLGAPAPGVRAAVTALVLHASGVDVAAVDTVAAQRLLFSAGPALMPPSQVPPTSPAAAPAATGVPGPPMMALDPAPAAAGAAGPAALPAGTTGESGPPPAAAPGAPLAAPDDSVDVGDASSDVWTTHTGLLFTLNLAALPAIAAQARAHPRGLSWCLLALGCRLAEAGPDDPAVRVFAGLAATVLTTAPLERHLTEPPTGADQRLLSEWTVRCDQELAARLPDSRPVATGTGSAAAHRRRGVIRRTARLVIDPGWIEAEVPLNSVDVAVRRAGLDLDPGAVPYLGFVVRFRYV